MSASGYIAKALFSEMLGTLTLVLIGGSAVAQTAAQGGSFLGSAFAFGLALMVLIYTYGSFSGGHFNPATSFGFAVAGRMGWGLMIMYWIAQLLGGIAAGALILYFYGSASGVGASIGSLTNTNAWAAVLLEAILTFFLVITILFVTRNPLLAVASGLAIGLVLTFDMLAGAPLTGASMNPARSLGPAIFSNNMGTYWIYVVGPLLGALVAALVYRLFTYEWGCCTKVDNSGKVMTDSCGNPIKECQRPLLDKCGNPIEDCDGKKYETYTKVERKLNHHQENALTAIGGMLATHGYDPRYVAQEVERAIEKKTHLEEKEHHHQHIDALIVVENAPAQPLVSNLQSAGKTPVSPFSSMAASTGPKISAVAPVSSTGSKASPQLMAMPNSSAARPVYKSTLPPATASGPQIPTLASPGSSTGSKIPVLSSPTL